MHSTTRRGPPNPERVAPDPAELVAAIGPDTVAVLLMGFEMPTGALLYTEHLDAITEPVTRHVAWVIYDAAKERIRFDDQLLPC